VLSNLFGLAGHKIDRGAEGTEGGGVWGGGVPHPIGGGIWGGNSATEKFSIFELKMASFGAFLV